MSNNDAERGIFTCAMLERRVARDGPVELSQSWHFTFSVQRKLRDVAVSGGSGEPLAPLIAARAHAELSRLLAEPLEAGLYLVATPIGNLADITLRALTVLTRADVIYCEDTRHSLTLTAHYGITTHLTPYHEHNGARERPKILSQLADGRRIALISDAGSDPPE